MPFTIQDVIDVLAHKQMVTQKINVDKQETAIKALTFDSRNVKEDTLFFCKGAKFKVDFLEDAIAKGAVAYVAEKAYTDRIPGIIVSDIRQAMPVIANAFYDLPWKKFAINGITGTKGKTTTTYFLKAILDLYEQKRNGKETAYFSSTYTYDGVDRKASALTTPESLPLFKQLKNVENSGIDFLTMEVSSQALKYRRVDEMRFDVVGFLNISTDHIGSSEHPDFGDYFNSKLKIFKQGKIAVINQDMDYFEETLASANKSETIEKVITFSRSNVNADYWASDIKTISTGQQFVLHIGEEEWPIELQMFGAFNVDNALMAIAIAHYYGIDFETIQVALKDVKAAGRMEVVTSNDKKIQTIVDFAHNKLSMQQLIRSGKQIFPESEIWVVTGSAGDKGQSRRKDMGEVIAEEAQKVYLTADDYNFEDPATICAEMAAAITHVTPDFTIESYPNDRHEAIEVALQGAIQSPIPVAVMIAGKGTDAYFIIEGEKVPYQSDLDFVQSFIDRYNESH